MSKDLKINVRETWLVEICAALFQDVIAPKMPEGWEIPPIRVSVGFCSNRENSNIAASMLPKEMSGDGINQIFVSPTEENSEIIIGSLAHELCHVTDNGLSGHLGHFKKLSLAIDLIGPRTATTMGDILKKQARDLIAAYGDIPHSKVKMEGRKKQTTRMIKITCHAADCGAVFRASKKYSSFIDYTSSCPFCGSTGTLNVEE